MDDTENEISELDIQAYVDGRLERDPHRKALVEAYLDENPAERERARKDRFVTEQIRGMYGDVLLEPVPARFDRLLFSERGSEKAGWLRSGAAAAGIFFVAWAGGWATAHFGVFSQWQEPDVAAVVDAHREVMVLEAAPSVVNRPLGLSRKAAKENGLLMAAPDLSALGYVLDHTEARELDGKYLTNLVYQDREGDIITVVFERPKEPADTTPIINEFDELQSAHWRDGALNVVVIGDRIEPNLPTIKSAVENAFRRIEKATPEAVPFGTPVIAEDQSESETMLDGSAKPDKLKQ